MPTIALKLLLAAATSTRLGIYEEQVGKQFVWSVDDDCVPAMRVAAERHSRRRGLPTTLGMTDTDFPCRCTSTSTSTVFGRISTSVTGCPAESTATGVRDVS
jgi:hypothetical protein